MFVLIFLIFAVFYLLLKLFAFFLYIIMSAVKDHRPPIC